MLVDDSLGVIYNGDYSLPYLSPAEQTLIWEKNYCAPGISTLPDDALWKYGWEQVRIVEHQLMIGYVPIDPSWDWVYAYDVNSKFMKSTPGYPWVAQAQSKTELGWEQCCVHADALAHSLMLDLRPVIFGLFPKIELPKQTKIEEHDQRMICSSPVDFSLLGKKLLGPVLQFQKRHMWRGPYMVGITPQSVDWTYLAKVVLQRRGDVTQFIVLDISGMEKTFNLDDVRQLTRLWSPYITAENQKLLDAFVDQTCSYLVRAPSGHLTNMWSFNPSGHPWTTHMNNRMILRYIASAFAEITGFSPAKLSDYLALAIYGDDMVIGVTDAAIAMGFTPAALKEVLARYQIRAKCPSEFLAFEDVDFLSYKFQWIPSVGLYGPCPVRTDKWKLTLLVRDKGMTPSQHLMKIVTIRNQAALNTELFLYAEDVLQRFVSRYEKMHSGDPLWDQSIKCLVPRDIAMCRLVGYVGECRSEPTPAYINFHDEENQC
jgi:hypothetical protein